jgi:hypothetical protein
MSDDLNADAAAIIWEHAKAQLAKQSDSLSNLRTRALGMLSVASLVAALFAARLPKGAPHWAVIIALVLFGLSVPLAIAVAAPRRDWQFVQHLDGLIELVDRGIAAPVDVTRNLASWSKESMEHNDGKRRSMFMMFRIVCILTAGQVIFWVIAVL